MTKREYIEDQDAEDPDDFIISLTTQVCTNISLTTEGI
jgi:exocyst complex component 4